MQVDIIYDLKKFGNIMHQMRLKGNLTQKKIRELVGINPETIRNMEYGLQLPTLDTLTKLSEVYNMDIAKVLDECKYERDDLLIILKKRIDNCAYDENVDNIDNLSKQLNEYLNDLPENFPNYFVKKIKQLKLIAELIKSKNKTDKLSVSQSIDMCIEAIKINHQKFNVNDIKDVYFDVLELRVLTLLSFQYLRSEKNDLATSIINTVIHDLHDHSKSNSEAYPMLINAYFMKSYLQFILGAHDQVISTADKGIQLSQEKFYVRFLPGLYFRKAISEYRLGSNTFRETLKLCFDILEVLGDTATKETYIRALEKSHNIRIEINETKFYENNPPSA